MSPKRLLAIGIALLCVGLWCLTPGRAQFGVVKNLVTFCGQGGNDSFTKLLVHFDGANASTAIKDSSPSQRGAGTLVGGTIQIQTSTWKFGGAAAGGGTSAGGNYWTFPNSADYAFGTADFTIDFWAIKRSDNFFGFPVWFEDNPSFQNGWLIAVGQNSGTSLDYFGWSVISAGVGVYSWEYAPAIGTLAGWHHYALVRSSGTFSGYVDGVAQTPTTLTGDPAGSIPNSSDVLRIMGGISGGGPANVDELRISNKARWTANFTPPPQGYCP